MSLPFTNNTPVLIYEGRRPHYAWVVLFTAFTVGCVCGNGVIDFNRGEECDGTELNGMTCETLGFAGGTLGCQLVGDENACHFDTSGCISCVEGEIQCIDNEFMECVDGVFTPTGEACDPSFAPQPSDQYIGLNLLYDYDGTTESLSLVDYEVVDFDESLVLNRAPTGQFALILEDASEQVLDVVFVLTVPISETGTASGRTFSAYVPSLPNLSRISLSYLDTEEDNKTLLLDLTQTSARASNSGGFLEGCPAVLEPYRLHIRACESTNGQPWTTADGAKLKTTLDMVKRYNPLLLYPVVTYTKDPALPAGVDGESLFMDVYLKSPEDVITPPHELGHVMHFLLKAPRFSFRCLFQPQCGYQQTGEALYRIIMNDLGEDEFHPLDFADAFKDIPRSDETVGSYQISGQDEFGGLAFRPCVDGQCDLDLVWKDCLLPCLGPECEADPTRGIYTRERCTGVQNDLGFVSSYASFEANPLFWHQELEGAEDFADIIAAFASPNDYTKDLDRVFNLCKSPGVSNIEDDSLLDTKLKLFRQYGIIPSDTYDAVRNCDLQVLSNLIDPSREDFDEDGIPNALDNCIFVANPDQKDIIDDDYRDPDDGIGDVCCLSKFHSIAFDLSQTGINDIDEDGVMNYCDNCPNVPNPPDVDIDDDGQPDLQLDEDEDGVGDVCDNCAPERCTDAGLDPEDCANPDQEDLDGNGIGDACECPDGGTTCEDANQQAFCCGGSSELDCAPDVCGTGDFVGQCCGNPCRALQTCEWPEDPDYFCAPAGCEGCWDIDFGASPCDLTACPPPSYMMDAFPSCFTGIAENTTADCENVGDPCQTDEWLFQDWTQSEFGVCGPRAVSYIANPVMCSNVGGGPACRSFTIQCTRSIIDVGPPVVFSEPVCEHTFGIIDCTPAVMSLGS